MMYEIVDGMGNVIECIEADNEADASLKFQQWLADNAEEGTGPLDFRIEPAGDEEGDSRE